MRWRRSRGNGERRWPKRARSTSPGFSGERTASQMTVIQTVGGFAVRTENDSNYRFCSGFCLSVWKKKLLGFRKDFDVPPLIPSGKSRTRLAERCGCPTEPTGSSARSQDLPTPTTCSCGSHCRTGLCLTSWVEGGGRNPTCKSC